MKIKFARSIVGGCNRAEMGGDAVNKSEAGVCLERRLRSSEVTTKVKASA